MDKIRAEPIAFSMPIESDNESVEEEDLFYFESDHLALRGNRDYSNMLRTIAMLEAQQIRVHQQIEELEMAKKRYLENPELLLEKLRNNEEIIAPNYMTIVKLPEIGTYDIQPPEPVHMDKEHSGASGSEAQTIRGRPIDGTKSATFNRLWSNDEQRRLEELLVEYPAEEIEMRRFTKIAKALGNRTPQQVSSRVQKYFQKLHDAGLPIPGRAPKYRKAGINKQKVFFRRSTFFPANNISINMPEDDYLFGDLACSSSSTPDPNVTIKTEVNEEFDGRSRERLLFMMKTIRDEKLENPDGYNPDPLAAKCAECEVASVSRTLWRCNSCYHYLNLCGDCLADQLINKTFEHISHDVVVAEPDT